MPKEFKIKKTYAKDQRQDACLRKIAFFNYEMANNIIMGRFKWMHVREIQVVVLKNDFENFKVDKLMP